MLDLQGWVGAFATQREVILDAKPARRCARYRHDRARLGKRMRLLGRLGHETLRSLSYGVFLPLSHGSRIRRSRVIA